MNVRFDVQTNVGLKRAINEDSYCVDESLGLFAVLDGLGGHRSGDVASKLASDIILQGIRDARKSGSSAFIGDYDHALSLEANQMASSIRLANQVIYERSKEQPEYKGMSSTVASVLVLDDKVVTAHVGDSRIYLLRNNSIEQVSQDHSFVQEQIQRGILTPEEASHSELKNIITRALGASENVQVSVREFEVMEDDAFLLCSDGLTDTVNDEEILQGYVRQNGDLDRICTDFVDLANERGGHDNITVLLLVLNNVKKRSWISGLFRRFTGTHKRDQARFESKQHGSISPGR